MAKVGIWITCGTCGAEFEHVHVCRNTRAAGEYEEWAKQNICECPTCYRKRVDAETQDIVAKWGITLPEIDAVSDKQREYAHQLRTRYISDNKDAVKKTAEILNKMHDEVAVNEAARERNVTPDEIRARVLHSLQSRPYYSPAYAALTETSARVIIDTLQ